MLDVTNWTALLVALSPLLIAALRRKDMSDNHVTLLTLVVTVITFFAGRALDGALDWPLSQSLAAELAAALVAQQTIYQVVRKTSIVKRLEASPGPPPGARAGLLLVFALLFAVAVPVAAATQTINLAAGDTAQVRCAGPLSVAQVDGGVDLSCAAAENTATSTATATVAPTSAPTATPTTGGSLGSTNPLGCSSSEVAMDSQSWWMPHPGQTGNNFGHLHTSLCFPHWSTLSGKVTFKVRSVMHMNPGTLYRLMIQVFGPNHANPGCNDDYALICVNFSTPRTMQNCTATGGSLSDAGLTCTWFDTLIADTALFDYDGQQEFRFRAFVREPDGKDMRTSTSLQAFLKNGHPVHDYQSGRNFMEARGWYTDVNYTSARIWYPPLQPVSGIWSPKVELKPGSGGLPVTSWYASLDGDFHKGNPGVPLCPNGVQGTADIPICGTSQFIGNLRIDTTKLANGWHRLFLQADAKSSTLGSTNSGVLAILFEVKN